MLCGAHRTPAGPRVQRSRQQPGTAQGRCTRASRQPLAQAAASSSRPTNRRTKSCPGSLPLALAWRRAVRCARLICPAAFVLNGAALAQVAPWLHVPSFFCPSVSAHCRTLCLFDPSLLDFRPAGAGGGNRPEFPRCFPEKVDLILADTSGKMDTWRNPVVSQLNSIL